MQDAARTEKLGKHFGQLHWQASGEMGQKRHRASLEARQAVPRRQLRRLHRLAARGRGVRATSKAFSREPIAPTPECWSRPTGGTLLFAEIGEMSAGTQAELLSARHNQGTPPVVAKNALRGDSWGNIATTGAGGSRLRRRAAGPAGSIARDLAKMLSTRSARRIYSRTCRSRRFASAVSLHSFDTSTPTLLAVFNGRGSSSDPRSERVAAPRFSIVRGARLGRVLARGHHHDAAADRLHESGRAGDADRTAGTTRRHHGLDYPDEYPGHAREPEGARSRPNPVVPRS